jgi:ATP-dependent protease HslVU (ClpYQ) peptidase subunit
MTTIAAIQGEDFAVIGFDSRLTRGEGGRVYTLPRGNGKVVKNNNYLIGAAGDLRAINLVSDVLKLPEPDNFVPAKLDKFFTTMVVPKIRSCFEDAGYGKEGSQESELIVCINGQVYEIGSDYDWNKDISGIYGIGSGGDYAVGALHAMVDRGIGVEDAKECMKLALEIAMKLDSASGGPINILVQVKNN